MTISVDALIERLGGAEAAARLTGVGTEAVRKWRQAGSIPSRHWAAVIAATGLALSDLSGGPAVPRADAARRPTATRCRPARPPPWCWPTERCSGAAASAPIPASPAPVGEVCFNTGMTGYQETLTDPSYAGQIITFTFPHIGNVGTNGEDIEAATIAARGLVVKQDVTEPSNWRSAQHLDAWLRARGIAGVAGVDTRALTVRIRDGGAPNGVLAFPADGRFDLPALRAQAEAWPGLEGMDLAKEVSCRQSYEWDETRWAWPAGVGRQIGAEAPRGGGGLRGEAQHPALPGLGRMPGDGGAGDGDRR